MNQDYLGYLLTVLIFIIAFPLLYTSFCLNFSLDLIQEIILTVFSLTGITISIWSILYMKSIGGYYPFDMFGRKIGHQTRFLITDGPYALCRNPMLLGFLIFHSGILIAFLSLEGVIIFIFEIFIIILQVKSEEKTLKDCYGEDYEEYFFETYRFLPLKKKVYKTGL